MELRHLRYFAVVAEEATLVAAAKRLGVAQPALTRQIHALEGELDVELFERGPKGVTLTPAGDVALASARHVLRQVDAAVERARGSSQGIAGRCVVCVGARSLASGLIGRIVARSRARYPDLEIGVVEAVLARQFRAIQLGEADIGMGVPAPPEYHGLSSEAIDYDVFNAVLLPSTHPLASCASIALSALSSETFIAWGSDSVIEWRRQIRAEFTRLGFRPAAEKEYDQLFAIGAAVAAGQGWTIIFRDGSALIPPGTTIVPVKDFKVALPHAMVYRADERRPVVRTVINVIRETVTEERAMRDGRAAVEVGTSQETSVAPDMDRVAPSTVLELRHLRYFCAVADAGSFGRAAEQLGLTQPALSRQVADLERVVAIPLLERVARGVSPSAAGASFNRSARRILDEVRSISGEAQRARRGMLARCVVACVPTYAARNLLTELVRECAGEQPKLELSIEDMATPAQPAAIRSGHVDLGVCHASPLSAIEERGLERSRLMNDLVNCALVADSSEFASRDSLSLHELANVPFIFPDRAFQPGMYDQLFKVFESLGFQPRVDDTYHGLQTIWTLVAEGHGWAIGFATQCEMPPPGTVAVPVENFSIPWGLDLLARDEESRSMILDVADRLHRIASART